MSKLTYMAFLKASKVTTTYLSNTDYYSPQNLTLSKTGSQSTNLHPQPSTSLPTVPFLLAPHPPPSMYFMPYSNGIFSSKQSPPMLIKRNDVSYQFIYTSLIEFISRSPYRSLRARNMTLGTILGAVWHAWLSLILFSSKYNGNNSTYFTVTLLNKQYISSTWTVPST